MRSFLKWTGILLGALLVGLVILYFITSEALPEGTAGNEAEQMADRMLAAVDQPGWDTTRYVSWDFAGRNQYLWDRQAHNVRVQSGDVRVLLHTKSVTGTAFKDGQLLTGEAATEAVQAAWANFCNDSFWLAAPFKVRDPGTTRELVPLEEGGQGLLVTYTGGGVTPGDSYLWSLDETGLPTQWKMWTSRPPLNGIPSAWTEYVTLPTGARLSTLHPSALFDLKLSGVKGGMTLAEAGADADPFVEMQ